MEIAHACQVPVQELTELEFDLILLGNQNNERCCFLLQNYSLRSGRTLVLINSDEPQEYRKLNPKLPPTHSLDIIELSALSGEKIVEYLDSFTNRLNHDELNILIDYSCMSTHWYASIIKYFYLKEIPCERVNVYFAYIPVNYLEPKKSSFKRDLHVILKDIDYTNPLISKQALIVGLGYDTEKTEFIIQKVNPTSCYFFYSQPSFDSRYTEKVLQLNENLIKKIEPGNLLPFPMNDMDATVEILTRLVLDLRLENKVVLASFGPKLLTLACVLLFARFPDIEILSTGSDNQPNLEDVPINLPVIYKAVFLSDEKCE